MAEFEIRDLTTDADFREAVALQKAIWGFNDEDLLPVRFFVVASKIGGQVFSAFDGGRMIGFCLAIPGLKPDNSPYLHSHMLGILPEYRDSGLGAKLKFRQRDLARARRIHLIEWTFDPLETRNAWFNIRKLGAIVRRYARNQYGITSSPLTGGLPTDRMVAEWRIDAPRPAVPTVAEIAIPMDIGEIRQSETTRAAGIQSEIADKFEAAFARGLTVIDVSRDAEWFKYLLGEMA